MTTTRPKWIRAMHQYAFRSQKWAALKGQVMTGDHGLCYVVEFEDGVADLWPVNDQMAQYEFRA